MPDQLYVPFVVLRVDPGLAVPLLGHQMDGTLNVVGREIVDERSWRHFPIRFAQPRRTLPHLFFIHVVNQPTCKLGNQISPQRRHE